jgi:hypothetical protein
MKSEDFRAADLPATEPGFKFDALLEFAHLGDFWTVERVHPYGEPAKGRERPH